MPEFQNPNLQPGGSGDHRGGGDFSSLMLMGFLAVAIFLGFQYFQRPKTNAPQPAQQQQQASSQSPAAEQAASPQPAPPQRPHNLPAPTPTIVAASSSTTTIENPFYRIVFSNKGALVEHWILNDYKDSSGHPLDMVQAQASSRFGFPLSLFTYDPTLTDQLNSALYQASATGTLKAPATLTFHYAENGAGRGQDLHLRFGLRDPCRRSGPPQRPTRPRAARLARRPRRSGGVPGPKQDSRPHPHPGHLRLVPRR